jgi:hypothetical protein
VLTTGASGATSPGKNEGVILNPVRFRSTTWNLPYEPSFETAPCSTDAKSTLKNEFANETSKTYARDYAVGFTVGLTGGSGKSGNNSGGSGGSDGASGGSDGNSNRSGASDAGKDSLKDDTTLTWTNSTTNSSSTDSTQSAAVTIACPSVSYTDPKIDVAVYWDSLYGTFLFDLVDPATTSTVHPER